MGFEPRILRIPGPLNRSAISPFLLGQLPDLSCGPPLSIVTVAVASNCQSLQSGYEELSDGSCRALRSTLPPGLPQPCLFAVHWRMPGRSACSSPGRWAPWLSPVRKSSGSTTISAITRATSLKADGKDIVSVKIYLRGESVPEAAVSTARAGSQ